MTPDAKLKLVAAYDIGRLVAAAVLEPERFNGAEIELCGDSLAMDEIATSLSTVTGRSIAATSLPANEIIARGQFSDWVNSQEWQVAAGNPATPADAQFYGITPEIFVEWAKRNAQATPR
jgi:uncharacterized protein YbjT (DUF2867 family)